MIAEGPFIIISVSVSGVASNLLIFGGRGDLDIARDIKGFDLGGSEIGPSEFTSDGHGIAATSGMTHDPEAVTVKVREGIDVIVDIIDEIHRPIGLGRIGKLVAVFIISRIGGATLRSWVDHEDGAATLR